MNQLPLQSISPGAANEEQTLSDLVERGREVLRRRRWWFIFSVLLTMAATVVITRGQARKYEALGTLYIDRQAPRVLSGMTEVVDLGTSGYWGGKGYYEAQIEVLQSRELGQMVVDRLGLATDEHFFGLDRNDSTKLTDEEKRTLMMNGDPAGMLAARLGVQVGKTPMVMRVMFRDTSPEFAKTVVNTAMQAYKDRNILYRGQATRVANHELRGIRKDMWARKTASEKSLLDFETEHDISDNRRLALNQRILSLEAALRTVQAKRFAAHQLANDLRKFRHTTDVFTIADTTLLSDPLLGSLKTRKLGIEMKLRESGAVYLERHPTMRALNQQLKHVAKLAHQHVNARYVASSVAHRNAVAEEKEIQRQLTVARTEDHELRKLQSEHTRLLAERDEDKRFYDMVAKRTTETDLSGQVDINNVRILDEAVAPAGPISPNVRLNYVAGMLLSLLIGLGAAVGVNMLDNTVKGRYEVEAVLKVPYLGAIPKFGPEGRENEGAEVPAGREDLYAYYRPNSRVAEASRSLRTNILFMRPDEPIRTMLVSSALPREGKTTTSTTLAIALAAANGSCVLVDTDLRKPRLHKVFGVSGDTGITSSVLTGLPVENFVKKTDVQGLYLLPCGPLPPDSSEIMHTERFRELVQELKEKYASIVFDSPPVEIVSDALVLGTLVDGVVLVAHASASRLDNVRSALRSFRAVNANVLGCVLSRTDQSGSGYGYYYGKGYRRGGRPYRYRYAAKDDDDAPRLVG